MISAAQHRGFIREITVFTEGTAQKMVDAMVRVATAQRDRVLTEQAARSGLEPLYRVFVDGAQGAALTSVKPDGIIIFAWNYLREVIFEAMIETAAAVPVQTGNLLSHLFLFVDGTEAGRDANGEAVLSAVTADTQQATIVAYVEYARRLEVGLDRTGAPFVRQVKQHFIEQAAIVLQSRFKDQAEIEFAYVSLPDASLSNWSSATRHRIRKRTAITFPSITITPRTG